MRPLCIRIRLCRKKPQVELRSAEKESGPWTSNTFRNINAGGAIISLRKQAGGRGALLALGAAMLCAASSLAHVQAAPLKARAHVVNTESRPDRHGFLASSAPWGQARAVPFGGSAHSPVTSLLPTFVENRGQEHPDVAFVREGPNASAYFTSEGVTLALQDGPRRWAIKTTFVGARPVDPIGVNRAPTIVSYFHGRPEQWVTGARAFRRIVYPDLWPGIDLVYLAQEGELKYEFHVAPGADPSLIELEYDGVSSLALAANGELRAITPLGTVADKAPTSYQRSKEDRTAVASEYFLEGRTVRFSLGSYDPTRPLVIDPVVVLRSGYLGGSDYDIANGIALDATGSAYITGYTYSSEQSFPVTTGPDSTYNGEGDADAFVAKLAPSGTGVAYLGYIGGSGEDVAWGITVDGSGAAYVTGETTSKEPTFPLLGGPDLTFNQNVDAFIAKVSPSGTGLQFSGYIGGADDDFGYGIAIDASGSAYIGGETASAENTFPVRTGPDLSQNGGVDGFVAKVTASGGGLSYAGYVGGSDWDVANAIAVDASGSAYLAGMTTSSGSTFPVMGGPDPTYNEGGDAFVTKVSPSGDGLAYSGYVGGSAWDAARGIAVDGSGNAYLTGDTQSSEATFPVRTGPDLTYNGESDAFAAKVVGAGNALSYAGYVGGSGDDYPGFGGIAVDGAGSAFLTGYTNSTQATFPVTAGPDLTHNGADDAYVGKLTPLGSGFVYASYIGGSQYDSGNGIAIDALGTSYVAGATNSTEATFPVSVGPDATFNGLGDAFITRVGTIHRLTVAKSGTGTGSVTSNPPGINCGPDCSEDYLEGTTVTLTATASTDSRFSGWSGVCSGTALTCQVSMDSPKQATAIFLETIPPETTITSGPPSKSKSTTAQFWFTSNEPVSTFECSLDGAPFQACTSPKSYSGLTEGAHGFRVSATDGSGNTDSTPAQASWTIDITPPDTTITSAPSGLVNSPQASFSFTSNESPAIFTCALDSGQYSLCSTPQSYSSVADGSHTFQVRAEDQAGNVDPTSATATWVVDAQGPVLTFLRPGPGVYVNDQSFGGQGPTVVFGSVSVQVRAQDLESGVASFRFEVDGAAVDPSQVTLENGVYRFSYEPASQGQHTITAKATNGSGIPSSSSIEVFGVPT